MKEFSQFYNISRNVRKVGTKRCQFLIIPDKVDLEHVVVEVGVEGGGVDVQGLALPRQDREHGAHHQQVIPTHIKCSVNKDLTAQG